MDTAADQRARSALDALTASVDVRLLTPMAARRALRILGLDWQATVRPPRVNDEQRIAEPGLYSWVAGGTSDPMLGGIIYWGIGLGATGVDGRLDKEYSWANPNYDHGHGMAVDRLNARAVRAPVRTFDSIDEVRLGNELLSTDGLSAECIHEVRKFLADLTSGGTEIDLKQVEWLMIRVSIQLGHTGPPVQSQHATAWANVSPADWTAFALRRYFESGRGAQKR